MFKKAVRHESFQTRMSNWQVEVEAGSWLWFSENNHNSFYREVENCDRSLLFESGHCPVALLSSQ